MRRLKGNFKLNDLMIDYDFELMGKDNNDAIFRMKFNHTSVDPAVMFIAGIMLMHYLANDFGCRIDISQVPKLESEYDASEAAAKYEKGEKQ